ncbi:MAG: questin oxidase family protein, partial [Roseiarcus sp.]
MTAASARAISSHRNPATRRGLERAVAWSRQWSAEFPFFLANHLPMVLVALHRMGASDERLEAYCQIYHEQHRLVPVPEPTVKVARDNWREFLGQREREGDYRAFFAGEVARLGATPAAVHYLPQLMPGMAASALHAFMRMAYATMTDSDEETGVALGYWAATYLPLGASQGRAPTPDDPAKVLAFMYGPPTFRRVETEQDLLWHFMRAIALKAEFAPVFDLMAIGPETHDRVARCSIALYDATLDF